MNVENMILSSFLYLNEVAEESEIKKDKFILDTSAFSSDYRKKVARRINEVEDNAYSFLSYQLEEEAKETINENSFLEILSQTPLPLYIVKKYYREIYRKNRIREVI